MHHLPRIFSPREKTAAKTTTDLRKLTRKSRLERRNAAKHFDNDTASTLSSLDDSSSSSLITRALDLSDRTSLRIDGVEGELERIFGSIGLSGPEDFAIPEAEWEDLKIRSSSDLLPRSRFNRLYGPNETVEKQSDTAAAVSDLSDRVSDSVRIRDEPELTRNKSTQSPAEVAECSCTATDGSSGNVLAIMVLSRRELSVSRAQPGECSSNVVTPTNGRGEGEGIKEGTHLILSSCPVGSNYTGGIKGVRPPVLKPPPAMTLPVIDNTCSTWDILRDFAPKDDRTSSDEEEEQERDVEMAIFKGEEEDIVLSEHESCSFTTSNDDDSSSTTTEPMSNISPSGMSNISPNGRFRRTIKYWEKGDLLGRGSFGSVYEGISHDGIFFAVKEVSLLDQGSQGRQSIYQLEQEIALLSQFGHQNIVQYYGTDKDESKLYIFLELVTKGSLLRLYQQYHLQDSQVSAYTRQILHGLKYLHNRNVVHRDIKCANILVNANGAVKLADFGLAKATKLNDVKSCRGTAFWMAPEVVNNKNQGYGLPADIWSLGCTVLEMLTRQIPYAPLDIMPALFRIGKGFPPPISGGLSKEAQDFIMQCLQVNPNDRPTAAKLLDHPFVKRPLATISGLASPYLGRR